MINIQNFLIKSKKKKKELGDSPMYGCWAYIYRKQFQLYFCMNNKREIKPSFSQKRNEKKNRWLIKLVSDVSECINNIVCL